MSSLSSKIYVITATVRLEVPIPSDIARIIHTARRDEIAAREATNVAAARITTESTAESTIIVFQPFQDCGSSSAVQTYCRGFRPR